MTDPLLQKATSLKYFFSFNNTLRLNLFSFLSLIDPFWILIQSPLKHSPSHQRLLDQVLNECKYKCTKRRNKHFSSSDMNYF